MLNIRAVTLDKAGEIRLNWKQFLASSLFLMAIASFMTFLVFSINLKAYYASQELIQYREDLFSRVKLLDTLSFQYMKQAFESPDSAEKAESIKLVDKLTPLNTLALKQYSQELYEDAEITLAQANVLVNKLDTMFNKEENPLGYLIYTGEEK